MHRSVILYISLYTSHIHTYNPTPPHTHSKCMHSAIKCHKTTSLKYCIIPVHIFKYILLKIQLHHIDEISATQIPFSMSLSCVQEFKKNVKGVNGGGDFDQDMLEEIYNAIRCELSLPQSKKIYLKNVDLEDLFVTMRWCV